MVLRVILLILFLLYSGGLFYGGFYWSRQNLDKSRTMLSILNNPQSPSYASLKGQIKGKVTKIVGAKIHIEPEKGGQAIFSLSPSLIVSEFKDGKMTELGKDSNSIRTGEKALIIIAGYNNGFAVTAISYYPQSVVDIPVKDPLQSEK